MRRQPPLFLIPVIVGVMVGGCAGQGSQTASAVPRPSETARGTQDAGGEGADLCAVAENASNELAAGVYRVDTTQPPMSFTLPEGFTAGCAVGAVTLFGPDGIVAIIAPVADVQSGGEQTPVDPTIEAVHAALAAGSVEATEAQPVEIGGAQGVEFVVTVGDTGVGLRSAAGQGWGFANDEFDTGAITLLEVDGTIVGIIRHGDQPESVADDVLDSLEFEAE